MPGSMHRRDWLRGTLAAGLGVAAWGRASAAVGVGRASGTLYVHARDFLGRDGLAGVFAINLADATWRQVAPGASPTARVSPDGRWLAYTSSGRPDEPERGLWLRPTDGDDEPRRISDLVGRPLWTDGGRSLIVSGSGSNPENNYGVPFETWRLGRDGGDARKLDLPEADLVVDVTADGRRLVVESHEAADTQTFFRPLWLVGSDGKDRRRLLDDAIRAAFPRLAPDGGSIVYYRFEGEPGKEELSLETLAVAPDAKPTRVVSEDDDLAPFNACWSPDGARLALMMFDRTRKPDGTKNDIIRGCKVAVCDASARALDVLPIAPASEPLWVLDWRGSTNS
jgi:Tol biopolymer transport system component